MEAGKCAFLTEIVLYLGNGEKRVHTVMWITVKSQVIRTRPIRHVTVYDLEQP